MESKRYRRTPRQPLQLGRLPQAALAAAVISRVRITRPTRRERAGLSTYRLHPTISVLGEPGRTEPRASLESAATQLMPESSTRVAGSGGSAGRVKGLHHVAYRCRDAETTRQFYEDFIGLQVRHLAAPHCRCCSSSLAVAVPCARGGCGHDCGGADVSCAVRAACLHAPCCGTHAPCCWCACCT